MVENGAVVADKQDDRDHHRDGVARGRDISSTQCLSAPNVVLLEVVVLSGPQLSGE